MFDYKDHVEEIGLYLENTLAYIEIEDEYISEAAINVSINGKQHSSENVENFFKKIIQAIQEFFGGLKENILKKSTEITMRYKLKQAEKDAADAEPDLSILEGKVSERKIQKTFTFILNDAVKTCSKIDSARTTEEGEKLFLSFEYDMVKINEEISHLVEDLAVKVSPSNVSASFQWELSGIYDEVNKAIQKINSGYCMKLGEKIDKISDSEEISLMKWKISYMEKIQSHIVSFGRKVSTTVSNKKFEKISKAYR